MTTPKSMLASGMPEAEVIERARHGDIECFEALYRLHKRRVYSLCLRMTGNTEAAEDLTQEAFLQLYRKIATFRGDSAFSTWVHRLTVNIVLMQLRKKVLPEISLDEDSGALAMTMYRRRSTAPRTRFFVASSTA